MIEITVVFFFIRGNLCLQTKNMTSILKNSNYTNLSNVDKCSYENLSTCPSRDFSVEKKMVKFNKVCKSLEVMGFGFCGRERCSRFSKSMNYSITNLISTFLFLLQRIWRIIWANWVKLKRPNHQIFLNAKAMLREICPK